MQGRSLRLLDPLLVDRASCSRIHKCSAHEHETVDSGLSADACAFLVKP